MENTLSIEGEAIAKTKERESEELKTFIENINRKEKSKDNVSIKRKEEEPKQYKWTDLKKYYEIHKHSIKNWVKIKQLRNTQEDLPYTDEEMMTLFDSYVELCNLMGYHLTLSGLALYLGVGEESPRVQALNSFVKATHEQKLLGSANNSNLAFLMKHRYKRNDKLEITATTNQQTTQGVVDRIIQENENSKGKALEIIQGTQ